MKPFLLLATRAEDGPADNEYAAMLRHGGLAEHQLVRHRLERDPLGDVDLGEWSGIILGGSPYNNSDPEPSKSEAQLRVEAELGLLARRVLEQDTWFLGACYGIGVLGGLRGGVVDTRYPEPVSAVTVSLTDEGRRDPLFEVLPERFHAFVGHKEAVSRLPEGAVLLASSATCPVQAFRMRRRVYATQFHPELDPEGLAVRVDAYRHHGYFAPHEAEGIKALARAADVHAPPVLLRRFVELATA